MLRERCVELRRDCSGETKDFGNTVDQVRCVASILPQCVKLADSEPLALQSGGDVVIGGLFPLHFVAPKPQNSYHSKPQLSG